MMRGKVRNGEAIVAMRVLDSHDREHTIQALIDTGYSGQLTMPAAMIRRLALPFRSVDRGLLADGSEVLYSVHEAHIEWNGRFQRVLVDEAETVPLIGMALLEGFELTIQCRRNGRVSIRSLR